MEVSDLLNLEILGEEANGMETGLIKARSGLNNSKTKLGLSLRKTVSFSWLKEII